ncbi:unnamed protein product, partial [Ectocarpus sp. 12 AP-2014]
GSASSSATATPAAAATGAGAGVVGDNGWVRHGMGSRRVGQCARSTPRRGSIRQGSFLW